MTTSFRHCLGDFQAISLDPGEFVFTQLTDTGPAQRRASRLLLSLDFRDASTNVRPQVPPRGDDRCHDQPVIQRRPPTPRSEHKDFLRPKDLSRSTHGAVTAFLSDFLVKRGVTTVKEGL